MTTIIIDDQTRALLQQCRELSALRDEKGVLLGFIAPAELEGAAEYAQAATRTSPLELQHSYQNSEKRYSTREVLEHLDSLKRP